MTAGPVHECRLLASPWEGVHVAQVRSDRSYGRHWHDSFGLGLIDAGAQQSASGRGEVRACAGDLVTTNPGEVHDGRPVDGTPRQWRTLYFGSDVLRAFAGPPGDDAAITRPVIADVPLRAALSVLLDRLQRWNRCAGAGTTDALACDEAMAGALGLLMARHGTRRAAAPERSDLAAVRDRIADAPLVTPTLAQLAAGTGLSRFQLLRQFQSAYGMTPHAWLLRQRAQRARGLIRRGVALAQAAGDAGFADQSHMTRIFVRHFGYSPGAWQRATRDAAPHQRRLQ